MSKTIKAVKLTRGLKADAKGSLPTEIEVVRTGYWNTPWHGDFEITTYDIDEAVAHFDAGVYRVQGTEPLPGTLDHLGGNSPAAFRITAVRREGEAMIASVEWTALGKEKLERDEYRYVSFEFYPRSMPFENPEKEGEMLVNVLTGATLTNDPLFKKLKPVMASVDAGNSDKANQEGGDMDLEQVRVKKLEDLTDDEKAFLAEHKADLTDEERATFQLAEEEPTEPTEPEEPTEPAAPAEPQAPAEPTEPVQASANGGLSAADIKQLQTDAKAGREASLKLARKEAEEFVSASVKKGAIKSDHSNDAVELLLASAGDQRTRLEKFIQNLPENEMVTADELGSGEGGEGKSAVDQVFAQAQARVDEGKSKNINEAVNAVLKADSGLAKQFEADRKSK